MGAVAAAGEHESDRLLRRPQMLDQSDQLSRLQRLVQNYQTRLVRLLEELR